METTSVLVFFFLMPLHMAQDRSSNPRGCGSFTCGNLDFKFPFFNTTMPSPCGLFKLNCSEGISEIQLVEKGQWYKVQSVSQANTITITDPWLNQSLITGNCTDLSSFSLPDSPWLVMTKLYKCNNNTNKKNGFTYENCGGGGGSSSSSLYYTNSGDDTECSTIRSPDSWLNPRNKNQSNVNATFSLHIDLPPGCVHCHNNGGECKMEKDKYRCVGRTKDAGQSTGATAAIAGIGTASALVLFFLITGGLFCLISRQRKTSDDPKQHNLKALIPLKQYSYAQVKRITKSFAEVVGKGGFGTVYRGTLCDGRSVAVKILKDSKGNNGEDFINEVASISKTSHVNIVSLLGFCSEGSKRAIIYEYLENGSLDKFISSNTSMNMDWMALYGIALGVARGIEYLHYGCKTRIVHFNIKPQNVLLDDNLCPKVSDFGLAKLCEKKESILSLLETRGTIGYIAPELFSRMYGRVSHKSDVYSYGLLVLEMIGARNKEKTDQNSASNTSSMYFPEWIYRDLEKGDSGRLIENGINSEEEEITKKMTLVGLWCIQSSPTDRPAMNRVVEMMEGSVDTLEVPPRPVFQIPTAPLQESLTLSDEISGYTEVCSINVA